MTEQTILLVEDEPEIRRLNRSALVRAGYRVHTADTLSRANALLGECAFSLIVLDILLPDGSGLDLCREIRAGMNAPILFLTSLGESEQIVRGLRAGGDDYMVKPYRIEELLARVEALLRRASQTVHPPGRMAFCGLTVDPAAQRAYLQGRDLLLKPKEYMLLAALLRGRDRCRTAAELYAEVWGMASNEDARTVLVHISNLRAKLRRAGSARVAIRRHGDKGYRLEAADREE